MDLCGFEVFLEDLVDLCEIFEDYYCELVTDGEGITETVAS